MKLISEINQSIINNKYLYECIPNEDEQGVLCETGQDPSGQTGSGPAAVREYPDGFYHPTGEDGIYAHGSEGTTSVVEV